LYSKPKYKSGIQARSESRHAPIIFHLRGAQAGMDKRIIIDLNPPITVGIKSAERFRQRLDHNTGADKAVECDTWRRATGRRGRGFTIIFALDELEELGVKGVPELGHGLREFHSVNGAGVVSIKVFEDTLPILDITPETRKLVEANGARTISVEDAHEHLDGIKVKWCPVAVD